MRQEGALLHALGQRHVRSTGGMLVSVESAARPCPVCGGLMHVQKTLRCHGVTLKHGAFVARETARVCAAGCRKDGALVTERAEVILPRLRGVVSRFGAPCAIMRDLGRAVTEACEDLVAELEHDIPILACHLHFLKDVGGDVLGDAHDQLRALLRRFKLKSALRAIARDLGRALSTEIAQARRGLSDWQARSDQGHVLPDGRAGLASVRAIAQWVLD